MAKRRGQAMKGSKLVGETNRRQGKAFEKGEKRKENK